MSAVTRRRSKRTQKDEQDPDFVTVASPPPKIAKDTKDTEEETEMTSDEETKEEVKEPCQLVPKRQRRKTQKGLELEQLLRRPSLEESSKIKSPAAAKTTLLPDNPLEAKSGDGSDPLGILYEAVLDYQDESGRRVAEIFQRLPPKSKYPEYYRVIVEPIDLRTIGGKLKNQEYKNVSELESDLMLMLMNAWHFNEPSSQVYKDASLLSKVIKAKKRELKLRPGSGKATEQKMIIDLAQLELYNTAAECRNAHDRLLSEAFQELPSRKEYPNYYSAIAEPMCLSMIWDNIQKGVYKTLIQLEQHLLLIFKNARKFNEPSSKIYRDATKLMQLVQTKREAEKDTADSASASASASASVTVKDDRVLTRQSSDKFSGAKSAAEVIKSDTVANQLNVDQLLALYNAVCELRDSNGKQLCKSFLSFAPSEKRSDARHLDMKAILKKIKANEYSNEDDCMAEFELMLSNVLISNTEDSEIFKDAVELDKLLKTIQRGQDAKIASACSISKALLDLPPLIQVFLLGTDLYVLGSELGNHLGLVRGEVYRQYPFLSKRLATSDERRQLVAQGMNPSIHQATLLFAKEVENILAEKRIKERCQQRLISPFVSYVGLGDVGVRFKYLPEEFVHHLAFLNADPLQSQLPQPSMKGNVSEEKLEEQYFLFEAMKSCKDESGREISALFLELPSKQVYPHYYQIIRKPMCLKKIEAKIRTHSYPTLGHLMDDLVIMCDNACRFNEQGSTVYYDSLALLKVAFRTRMSLLGESRPIPCPDVAAKMQQMLNLVYQAMMDVKGESGRRPSDSFSSDVIKSNKTLSLSMIGSFLEQGYYTHLHMLQRDIFRLLEWKRRKSPLDSLAYGDAVLLQTAFIAERDKVFCHGQLKLQSSSLSLTAGFILKTVAAEKRKKVTEEQQEAKEEKTDKMLPALELPDVTFEKQCTVERTECRAGDFVYLTRDSSKTIFFIQKLWIGEEGEVMAFGRMFYLPEETVHSSQKKFLQKEVLLNNASTILNLTKVNGKCVVMNSVQYFTHRPKAFDNADVYYCESVYDPVAQKIENLKNWLDPGPPSPTLSPRSSPIPFNQESSSSTEAESNLQADSPLVCQKLETRILPQNVKLISASSEGDSVYYEQYCTNAGSFKTGDFVYVQTEKDYPFIARIDQIWTDKLGKAWFHGPWFVRPFEVEHLPTRTFFVREVLLSSVQDTNPLESIISRCAVLNLKDYAYGRLVGITEEDVFVCESRYNEAEQLIRKLKGLKKFSHSNRVVADEFFFFDTAIWPLKVPSPLLFDKFPDLLGANDPWSSSDVSLGFALYASEVLSRQKGEEVVESAFQCTMERALNEWTELDGVVRTQYDDRAEYLQPAEKQDKNLDDVEMEVEETYCCFWQDCGKQFNSAAALVSHVLATIPKGHAFPPKSDASDCSCLWVGCSRSKKPFTSAGKLLRHLKDMHLKPYMTKMPVEGSAATSTPAPEPNLCASCQVKKLQDPVKQSLQAIQPLSSSVEPPKPLPTGFRFVEPPSSQRKLYHTQAYMKYVENLRAGQRTISDSTDLTVVVDTEQCLANEGQLEKRWLPAGRGPHESVVEALGALRDVMVQDSLKLAATLETS